MTSTRDLASFTTPAPLPDESLVRPFPDRPRGRSARALANDEALRDAALEIVVESGWEALALQGVASRASLTVGAIYARAESKSELGIDLWRARALPALEQALAGLRRNLGGDVAAYRDHLTTWFAPEPALATALELIVSACYDPDLGDVVLDDLRVVAGMLRPAPGDEPAGAARSRLDLALGATFITLAGTRIPVPAAPPLERALAAPARVVAPVLVEGVPDDDEALRMLDAARDVLVRVGHRRATAARIARAAGVMTSTLFARFPTKALLFAAAIGGREIEGPLALELERLGRNEPALARWADGASPAAKVHALGRGLTRILFAD